MKTKIIITAAGMLIAPAILKVLPLGKDLGWAYCFAQNVGISAAGTVPDNTAMLDVVSTTRGMLIPRMTTAERDLIGLPGTPATGLEIFNTDCGNFNYWNGNCWVTTSKNLPEPRNLTGATDMCAASVQVYSITAVPGATYYDWTVPAGATFTGQGTTSVSVTFGNFSGQVCVKASNNCETSTANCKDVAISPIPNTPGNITGPVTVKPGENSANYFIASVQGASVYNWTVPFPGASQIVSGAGTTSIMVNYACNATSGNVSVTAQSACGTSAPATLAVTVGAVLAVNAGVDKFGGAAIGGTATGGEGTYTYVWTPANNLSSYTIATPTSLCTGSTTTYTETVTDANGCTATDAVVVTRNLTVNAGADGSSNCPTTRYGIGNTATGGAGGYSYSWSPGTGLNNPLIANPSAAPTSNTTYTVTVTDANSCTATDAVFVQAGFNNGAGGTYICNSCTNTQHAQAACISLYGACTTGSCGNFFYWYQSGDLQCNCSKAIGKYEWIYNNTGYTQVGQDYGGQATSVAGDNLFVRQKGSGTCDGNSWILVLKELGDGCP